MRPVGFLSDSLKNLRSVSIWKLPEPGWRRRTVVVRRKACVPVFNQWGVLNTFGDSGDIYRSFTVAAQ
jgi:hypothetical protein